LMAAIVHAAYGLPFAKTVLDTARTVMVAQFVYVGLAAIAYILWVSVGVPSLVLLIVPLLVARQSLLTVQNRQEAFDRMVGTFVAAIQAKDGYTRGHAERVSDLSVLVAERMGLSYDERQLIRYGAILHDVGKIGVSIGVLCKAGPLTDDEFGEMKQHPEIGAEMLSDIDFLKPALAIVEHHHERLDGRGYPAGLEGDDIPLLTRIVTAVDAFDAMTSTRPYRRALPVSVAIEELTANAGSQFCPRVVEHLVAVIAEEGWELTDVPVHAIPVAETP
jgi:putative nucleotidyltransferase with HDIG domain